jgi:hypothetical protein
MAMHPEGIFDAEIVEHGLGESSGGTPEVWVRFATSEGLIVADLWITEKTSAKVARQLRNCGFSGKTTSELKSNILAGNMAKIRVKYEEYKGKITSRVIEIYPFGYQSPSPSMLDDAFGKITDAAPVHRKAETPNAGDEVPF